MLSRKVVVTNPHGIHARPADMLVKLANKFQADISIVKGSERVDCKSILSILCLAATQGTELSIEAAGNDAEQAVAALAELAGGDFGET
jgi:phosphotransferase system HPr (HPr) family protein